MTWFKEQPGAAEKYVTDHQHVKFGKLQEVSCELSVYTKEAMELLYCPPIPWMLEGRLTDYMFRRINVIIRWLNCCRLLHLCSIVASQLYCKTRAVLKFVLVTALIQSQEIRLARIVRTAQVEIISTFPALLQKTARLRIQRFRDPSPAIPDLSEKQSVWNKHLQSFDVNSVESSGAILHNRPSVSRPGLGPALATLPAFHVISPIDSTRNYSALGTIPPRPIKPPVEQHLEVFDDIDVCAE
uniref:Uncharacterized protein n=1 Tax=Timema douglasi TaxID=61478 RepID=A0A7R8VTC8_TIMDO|nr:unnamed protein product [Timema douglasi]